MKDKKVYKSNVGVMYFFVSLIIAAILIGSFLYTRGDGNVIVTSIAFIIAAITYYFALIYPVINTKYILETDRLVINCGIYKNEIAFQEILELYKKKSLGRQPALSEKMVFIKYKDRGVTNLVGISPKNRDEFIQEIQKNPKLTKDEHNDIIKLYDQKFAKQGLFVRKKYDSILANREARCLI